MATDIVKKKYHPDNINFEFLNCLESEKLIKLVKDFRPCMIINFSALLSGTSEQYFDKAIEVNLQGFLNSVKAAETVDSKLFVPSSIAAYGFESE